MFCFKHESSDKTSELTKILLHFFEVLLVKTLTRHLKLLETRCSCCMFDSVINWSFNAFQIYYGGYTQAAKCFYFYLLPWSRASDKHNLDVFKSIWIRSFTANVFHIHMITSNQIVNVSVYTTRQKDRVNRIWKLFNIIFFILLCLIFYL